jgi:hypothetical protein
MVVSAAFLIEHIKSTGMVPVGVASEECGFLVMEGLDLDVYEAVQRGERVEGGATYFWLDKETGDLIYTPTPIPPKKKRSGSG